RFIFNWIHALNALTIKGLAVAAIFTGLMLADSSPTQWMPKVMGGFVAWEALLFLCQDLYHRCREKDMDKSNG
ncbi:putative ferric-chelate reductase 1, partial [Clarias magur]